MSDQSTVQLLSSTAVSLLMFNVTGNVTSTLTGRQKTTIERIVIYIPPVWWIIGIPGNILAGMVWIQRQMRPSSGIFLAVLALDEFIFLVLQMLFEVHDKWEVKILNYPYLCEAFPITFLTTQQLSPLLVLGFTIQRYVAICHPFLKERFCTTRRSVATIVILLIFSFMLNAVQAYFWTFDAESMDCTLRSDVTIGGMHSPWSIYSWITELLVYGVVPVSIFILNIMVVRETRRLSKAEEALTLKYHHTNAQHSNATKKAFRQDSGLNGGGPTGGGGGSGRPSATTLTLLVVSSYLIFTVLPVTIFYVLYPAFSEGDQDMSYEDQLNDLTWQRHYTFSNIRAIVEEIGKSHYALNFYIYLVTGRIFRKQLKMLFIKFFCRGRRASQYMNRSNLSSSGQHHHSLNSAKRVNNHSYSNNDKTTPLLTTPHQDTKLNS